MKRMIFVLLLSLVITLGYLSTSAYSVHIGQNILVTNHTKAEVLVKNFVGNIRGFAKDNLSGLSFYIIGDDYEMVAVRSADGRMVGHMVSKYTAVVLKKLMANDQRDLAYDITKGDIGNETIYPLRFISWDEIEPKDLGVIELPVPQERIESVPIHPIRQTI